MLSVQMWRGGMVWLNDRKQSVFPFNPLEMASPPGDRPFTSITDGARHAARARFPLSWPHLPGLRF
jgi:hypothetical protein